MLRKSVEYLVGKAVTRGDYDCVVVQRHLLRDLCRVFPMRGDLG